MPIPETPNTREEMYLNAMATGDSIGIPPVPYTRQEMYLDAIARNGGGGSSGGGVLVVHGADGTLDKTWQEIHDADFPIINIVDGENLYTMIRSYDGEGGGGYPYHVIFVTVTGSSAEDILVLRYEADSANGYPAMQGD